MSRIAHEACSPEKGWLIFGEPGLPTLESVQQFLAGGGHQFSKAVASQ